MEHIILFSTNSSILNEIPDFLFKAGYKDVDMIPTTWPINEEFPSEPRNYLEEIISIFEHENFRYRGNYYYFLFTNKIRLDNDLTKFNLRPYYTYKYGNFIFYNLAKIIDPEERMHYSSLASLPAIPSLASLPAIPSLSAYYKH